MYSNNSGAFLLNPYRQVHLKSREVFIPLFFWIKKVEQKNQADSKANRLLFEYFLCESALEKTLALYCFIRKVCFVLFEITGGAVFRLALVKGVKFFSRTEQGAGKAFYYFIPQHLFLPTGLRKMALRKWQSKVVFPRGGKKLRTV